VFLRGLLRIDPHDASQRVKTAQAIAPRRALTGEPLPAEFEQLAAAQDAGGIAERHARIVIETIDALPDDITATLGEQIDGELVEYARRFDPLQLGKLARRLGYCYDQDGALAEVERRSS
jgi:hypothetical protein